MEIENLLNVKTREELRDWLQENCSVEKSCWVIISISPKPNTVLYLDAVEESMCFGWIDGIRKKISETQLAQRLSPRVKNSPWTELNKERVRRLEKMGLMTEEGRKVLPDMSNDSFKMDDGIDQRLKSDKQVYENFLAFPDLYKRIRINTIQSYRKQPELFKNRLDKFINNTKENKMYGDWHDNGRLLDY